MVQFVPTDRGHRRLSDVKEVRVSDHGKHSLHGEEGEKISEHGEIVLEHLVSIIPITGEWEQVYTCDEGDGSRKVYSEPVIAWGLTASGKVIPVTPTAPEGLPHAPSIRKVGRPEIYAGSTTYDNEEHWVGSSDA